MDAKRKVLIIRSNPVDPDPRVEKEAGSLLKAGYDIDILSWDRADNYHIKKDTVTLGGEQCDIYRVGIRSSFGGGFRNNIGPLLKFQLSILSFLRKNRNAYDVIHACDFDTAFSGYIGSRNSRARFVYDIFDYYADAFSVPSGLKKAVVGLDSYIINKADAVIICSEQRKEQIAHTKPRKLIVIHNSPEQVYDAADDAGHIKSDRKKIVYVGILNEGRMIPELLEIVSEEHERFELHIAGFGKFEQLVQEYSDKYENIEFYGRVQYSETLEIENAAHIMTAIYDPDVPNHKYAAPNKFYEALMLGKPLIMCRGTGMSDLVEEYGFGVCTDYTKDSIRDGLVFLADHYDDYAELSEKERKVYTDSYSWSAMEERLTDMYDGLFR